MAKIITDTGFFTHVANCIDNNDTEALKIISEQLKDRVILTDREVKKRNSKMANDLA